MNKRVPASAGPGEAKSPGSAPDRKKTDVRKTPPRAPAPPEPWLTRAAIRETVESIVIAFVLAFLFRAFEAEAFVIPTGSMATTLMGRYKDVECVKCGFAFQVGASEEVDPTKNTLSGSQVLSGICPNCRFAMSFSKTAQGKTFDSFNGDRIIVAKYPYHISEPQRFDIVVFQYPGEAKTNYIKRLVGLPGESIRIHRGDIFAKPADAKEFSIARKPPSRILAMMRPVYDADFPAPELRSAGYPARWMDPQPVAKGREAAGHWRADAEGKSFQSDGSASGDAWLCYRHIPPTRDAWARILTSGQMESAPKEQLITDFASYNSQLNTRPPSDQSEVDEIVWRQLANPPQAQRLGLHWVGDLIVEASLEIESAYGGIDLMLVKAGRRHVCSIDLATGTATLSIDGFENFRPKAATKICKPGKYDVRFANVDEQLHLWVNGRVASFDAPTAFVAPPEALPDREDLRPVRIGSRGAALRVDHLRVFRDTYYIACKSTRDNHTDPSDETVGSDDMNDFRSGLPFSISYDGAAAFYSDPDQWYKLADLKTARFEMKKDEFFMLGDNSPESKDGRLWESPDASAPREHYVRRGLVKGKAIFIYWPHSWDRLPWTDRLASLPNGVWCPYFPNFSRMGFIR
jgi:signal peptidase I